MKNMTVKCTPEGVASITVSGGLNRYTEISHKIRRLGSLPTDYCKVDLEVYTARRYVDCPNFISFASSVGNSNEKQLVRRVCVELLFL